MDHSRETESGATDMSTKIIIMRENNDICQNKTNLVGMAVFVLMGWFVFDACIHVY